MAKSRFTLKKEGNDFTVLDGENRLTSFGVKGPYTDNCYVVMRAEYRKNAVRSLRVHDAGIGLDKMVFVAYGAGKSLARGFDTSFQDLTGMNDLEKTTQSNNTNSTSVVGPFPPRTDGHDLPDPL